MHLPSPLILHLAPPIESTGQWGNLCLCLLPSSLCALPSVPSSFKECLVGKQDQTKLDWTKQMKAGGKFVILLEREWRQTALQKHGPPPADHWKRLLVRTCNLGKVLQVRMHAYAGMQGMLLGRTHALGAGSWMHALVCGLHASMCLSASS